ncbi:hypothetical protein [Chitinophaga skermanii]|nr:hypothetical protein [Chitinophaga skermanii]
MKSYFNTNKVLTGAVLSVFAVTVFFACKKDDKQNEDVSDNAVIAVATQQSEAADLYDDAFDIAVATNANNQGSLGRQAANEIETAINSKIWYCASASVSITPLDLTTWPKTVSINFNTGCTDSSRTRSGKVNIVLSKPLLQTGATATITFESYKVNGISIQGKEVITNLSANNALAYSIAVTGGKITYPDGSWATYDGTRTVKQTAGANTLLNLLDDVFSVEGSATVSNSNNNSASVVITKPLVRKLNCGYISEGTLKISVLSQFATIDYGNGNCDNKALLTYNNKEKEIILTK